MERDSMMVPFAFPLLLALSREGVRCWLIGGMGIELIVARDLRPHDDLDLFVAHADAGAATLVLEGLGFRQVHGSLEDGDVFYRRDNLVIDLVPIDDAADPPRTSGDPREIVWLAGLLEPHVVLHDGQPIVTLSPEMHLWMKAVVASFFRVEPRPKDLMDTAALDLHLSERPALS